MHSILKFFKVSFSASLSYKYIEIWYFHGQYEANDSGTNEISLNFFDLRHVSKVAALSQKKNKMFVYSFKYPIKESKTNIKTRGCRAMFTAMFIDVWYGSKYTPKVVQDSKINLKLRNTKILEKTAFLQSRPCRVYLYVTIPKISEAAIRTCITT